MQIIMELWMLYVVHGGMCVHKTVLFFQTLSFLILLAALNQFVLNYGISFFNQ